MKQKFINYNEDCEWAFGLNRMILNLLGVWPNDGRVVRLRSLRAPFSMACIFMGFWSPQMYALVKVYPNLKLIIDNLFFNCASLVALTKLYLIWHNRQALEPLVHWMSVDWTREKSIWERDLMLRQAQRGRLFTISGLAMMMLSIVGFGLAPFLGIKLRFVNNITDPDGERRYLPVQTYYPYDFSVSPNFELTYVALLSAVAIAGAAYSGADNFFGVLVFHAAGQCEILAARLARLFDFDENVPFKAKLRCVVDRHVHLVRLTATIENSFNILILTHTVCMSVTVCCSGYTAISAVFNESAAGLSLVQIAMLASGLLDQLLHMLVYCTATEILILNSEKFIEAIYNSDWFLFPSKYSRDAIPLMIRSQCPLRLTAGKFFYLSLNAYVKILKTSAGYISMLFAVS